MNALDKIFPKIIHYTTADGLKGIVQSKCFHATHLHYLNDETDGTVFADRFLEIYREAALDNETLANEYGDGQSLKQALLSKALFQGFVACFSGLKSDANEELPRAEAPDVDAEERINGVLSQWRGYGTDGGYAIILDTKMFMDRLQGDSDSIGFANVYAGSVNYVSPQKVGPSIDKDVEQAEAKIREVLLNWRGQELGFLDMAEPLLMLQFLFKDIGFREEREVRACALVAVRPDLIEHNCPGKKEVAINFRPKLGALVPYVEIATQGRGEERDLLPIERVIIGPNRLKERRRLGVEQLLRQAGYDNVSEMVTVSNIPYV